MFRLTVKICRKAHVPNVTPRVFTSVPPPPTSHSAPPASLVIPPWLPCHLRLGTTTCRQIPPSSRLLPIFRFCPPPLLLHLRLIFLFANYVSSSSVHSSQELGQLEQTSLRGISLCWASLYGGWVTRPPGANWSRIWIERKTVNKLKEIELIFI